MASSLSQKIFSHFSMWTAFLVLPTARMQKMYKESGVCGQLLCQPRASSAMAEICAACSLSAYMSSDLARRRRMTMGARSRLSPLQIKPLVCPALEWRGPGGRASSAVEYNEQVELHRVSKLEQHIVLVSEGGWCCGAGGCYLFTSVQAWTV